jgi:hypothetical protein
VFYERFDTDIVEPVGGSEVRVRVRALRQQVGVIACRWVLWYRGLYAFDGEPVCYACISVSRRQAGL